MAYLNQMVERIVNGAPEADIDIKELRGIILRNYKCEKTGRKHVFTTPQANIIVRTMVKHYKTKEYSLNQMIDLAQREIPGILESVAKESLREKAIPHKTRGGLFHIPEHDVKRYISKLKKEHKIRKNSVSLHATVKQICPTNAPNAMIYVTGELGDELEQYKENGRYVLPKDKPIFKKVQGAAREYKRQSKLRNKGTGPKKISKLPEGSLIVKEALLYLQEGKGLFYVNRDEHLQRYTHFRGGDEFDYVLQKDIDEACKKGDFRFVPFFIISRILGGNYKVTELQEKEKLPERMVLIRDSQHHENLERDGGFLLGDVKIALSREQKKLKELETLVKQYEKNIMPGN